MERVVVPIQPPVDGENRHGGEGCNTLLAGETQVGGVVAGNAPPEERRLPELMHERLPLFFVGGGVHQLGGVVRGGPAAAVVFFLVGTVDDLAAEIVPVSSHLLYIYNKYTLNGRRDSFSSLPDEFEPKRSIC